MTRNSWMLALASALMLEAAPALAVAPPAQASASYNPWVAAGLNYVPMALDATLLGVGTGFTSPGYPQTAAAILALNPTPGLGHAYVGEPGRGLTIFGASLAMGLGMLAANVALYQGRHADPRWQDQVRDGVNVTYFVSATLLSTWAAWDAYRIAEDKNRAAQ